VHEWFSVYLCSSFLIFFGSGNLILKIMCISFFAFCHSRYSYFHRLESDRENKKPAKNTGFIVLSKQFDDIRFKICKFFSPLMADCLKSCVDMGITTRPDLYKIINIGRLIFKKLISIGLPYLSPYSR